MMVWYHHPCLYTNCMIGIVQERCALARTCERAQRNVLMSLSPHLVSRGCQSRPLFVKSLCKQKLMATASGSLFDRKKGRISRRPHSYRLPLLEFVSS